MRFRRTPQLVPQQRERQRPRGRPDWVGVILEAVSLAMVLVAVLWILAFNRPSLLKSVGLVLAGSALIWFRWGWIRRFAGRTNPRQPTADEMYTGWQEAMNHTDGPFPRELFETGLPKEVFEHMERTGGIQEGGRTFRWTAVRHADGHVETHFHEDNGDPGAEDAPA
jgi:hypothetical protein